MTSNWLMASVTAEKAISARRIVEGNISNVKNISGKRKLAGDVKLVDGKVTPHAETF